MKLQLTVLFSIILIASAARERVLYEAFSGLDCQDADLGSITVRYEDSTDVRFDCTNYASTSFRSTANAPLPDPLEGWAYIVVQESTCPITDAMEYTIYAGKPSKNCWTYSNFTVYVDGVNMDLSINLANDLACKEVDFLEDYMDTPAKVCRQISTKLSHGSGYGLYPMTFAPVAAPLDPPMTQQTPTSAGSPQSNTPTKSNTPGKSNNAATATAGFVAFAGIASLCL